MCCQSVTYAETQIIPSIIASERYDSNVWRSPSQFLPPGTKLWDMVTGLGSQVEVANKSSFGDTKLYGGLSGNIFVNNPALNYISTNVGLNSDLTRWIRELIPGARLRISDSFLYTPEPPGFVTGVKTQDPDAFARGVVAFRANTYTNNATVAGSYGITRSFGIQASYTNSIYRVAQVYTPDPSTSFQSFYFNSTVHTASVGPTYRLGRGDTIGLSYQPTYFVITGQAQESTSVTAHSLRAEYTKELRGWTATASAGPLYLEEGSQLFFGGRIEVSTDVDASTKFRFTGSREVVPAIFATPSGMLSNTVGLSIDRNLERDLWVSLNAYYYHYSAVPVEVFKYDSVITGIRLKYQLARDFSASIAYDFNNFSILSGNPGALQGFAFDRHAVTFSLGSKWK